MPAYTKNIRNVEHVSVLGRRTRTQLIWFFMLVLALCLVANSGQSELVHMDHYKMYSLMKYTKVVISLQLPHRS